MTQQIAHLVARVQSKGKDTTVELHVNPDVTLRELLRYWEWKQDEALGDGFIIDLSYVKDVPAEVASSLPRAIDSGERARYMWDPNPSTDQLKRKHTGDSSASDGSPSSEGSSEEPETKRKYPPPQSPKAISLAPKGPMTVPEIIDSKIEVREHMRRLALALEQGCPAPTTNINMETFEVFFDFDNGKSNIAIKIKPSTPIAKICRAACEAVQSIYESIRFVHNGTPILSAGVVQPIPLVRDPSTCTVTANDCRLAQGSRIQASTIGLEPECVVMPARPYEKFRREPNAKASSSREPAPIANAALFRSGSSMTSSTVKHTEKVTLSTPIAEMVRRRLDPRKISRSHRLMEADPDVIKRTDSDEKFTIYCREMTARSHSMRIRASFRAEDICHHFANAAGVPFTEVRFVIEGKSFGPNRHYQESSTLLIRDREACNKTASEWGLADGSSVYMVLCLCGC